MRTTGRKHAGRHARETHTDTQGNKHARNILSAVCVSLFKPPLELLKPPSRPEGGGHTYNSQEVRVAYSFVLSLVRVSILLVMGQVTHDDWCCAMDNAENTIVMLSFI